MRATTLLRWGLACLLLAPLAFLAWLIGPRTGSDFATNASPTVTALALGWTAAAPVIGLLLIVAGGVLNALAIRRGVRGVNRIAHGDWQAPELPSGPRLIFPAGWEDAHPARDPRRRGLSRRVLGPALSVGLVVLAAIALWVLAVEFPLGRSHGLSLDEVRAAIGPASAAGDAVGIVLWAVVAVALSAIPAALGMLPNPALDRVLSPRRFAALGAVIGAAIIVATTPLFFTIGISLADSVPPYAGGSSVGSWLLGQVGIGLCAAAILLTVPRWPGAVSPRAAASP